MNNNLNKLPVLDVNCIEDTFVCLTCGGNLFKVDGSCGGTGRGVFLGSKYWEDFEYRKTNYNWDVVCLDCKIKYSILKEERVRITKPISITQ